MSLKLERLIERVEKLEAKQVKDRREINFLRAQLHNGMTDLATTTVTKILEQGIEAEIVEPSTDEKIGELINVIR